MKESRRKFIVRAGMMGALSPFVLNQAIGQEQAPAHPAIAKIPTPQEAAIDPQLPPEATNGGWKKLRAVREKKVFDLHTHIFESPVQGTTYHEEQAEHINNVWCDFSQQLVESMDRYGVAQSLVSPAWATYDENMKSGWLKHRDRLLMAVTPETGEIGVEVGASGGGLSPERAQKYADIIRGQLTDGMHARCTAEGGIPAGWKDPRELKPYMDVVMEFGIPVMIPVSWSQTRTAVGLQYETATGPAARFAALAVAYPDVTFVMNHMGGRVEIPDGYEAIRCAMGLDNAVVELSKSTAHMITYAVQELGAEKVLYGSDWNRPQMKTYGPLNYHEIYQQWYALNQVAQADLTEDQRDLILYKNARRLLKLS